MSALTVTVLLALTGCSGDDKASDASPTNGKSPSPTTTAGGSVEPTETPTTPVPSLTADANGEYDYCGPQTTPFTGDAAKEFGAKKVMDAYCMYAEISMEQTYVDNLMRSGAKDLTAADFGFWLDYMTEDTQSDWTKAVEKSLAGDDLADDSAVWALTFYDGASGTGYSFTDEAVVSNQEFSPARTHVDTTQSTKRLGLTFTVSADLNVVKNGTEDRFFLIPLSKEITYYLTETQNAQRPWLIDGWYATFDSGDPRRRPRD